MSISPSIRPRRGWIPRWLAAIAFIAMQPAHASVFKVGTGAGCTQPTIQAAITAAESNAGADTIWITRSVSYEQQALVLTTAQEVDLIGGFATCNQATSDGNLTDINGAGGATEPVMRITANNGGLIRLRHLTIEGGDEDGSGHGGGIFYRGNGSLQISDSSIADNLAGYGGGIYAEGTGTNAELIIGANVVISDNIARYSGGGIYVDGLEMAMREHGSLILNNIAQGASESGYGGGLMVLSRGDFAAHAYISGGGFGTGTIVGNTARYGGGVAVVGNDGADANANLHMYTIQADRRAMIRNNVATVGGGGIFMRSGDAFFNGELSFAFVNLWNADLVGNQSVEGAAAYLENDFTYFTLNYGNPPDPAVFCPAYHPCGNITGNLAQSSAGQSTSGAVIWGGGGNLYDSGVAVVRGGVLISGNSGGRLVDGVSADFSLTNAVVANNVVSQQLFRVQDGGIELTDSTVAGNTIGASQVFALGYFYLRRSIIWQPGKTTLTQSGGTLSVERSIASEIVSLGGEPGASFAEPRFIDPARGDYRLRAASPAIDLAPAEMGDDRDIHALPRDQGIGVPRPMDRVRDIGAYEGQSLNPLVLNSDFDLDFNLWTTVNAAALSRDTTVNATGAAGSGSAKVALASVTQQRVTVLAQCIHLPKPGIYLLNGWGRSGLGTPADRDSVILAWGYRRNGGEACNVGPPNVSGDHLLTRASSWVLPSVPATIVVPESEWNHLSSISVSLVVVENGVTPTGTANGWFDGVTLSVVAIDDVFASGFE